MIAELPDTATPPPADPGLVARAAALLGEDPPERPPGPEELGALADRLDDAAAATDDGRSAADRAALTALAARVAALEMAVAEHEHRRRTRLLADVEAGLARVRRMGGTQELVARVLDEAMRVCGLGRGLLSRVEDGRLVAAAVAGDLTVAEACAHWGLQDGAPIGSDTVEAHALVTGRGLVVTEVSGSAPYLVVPIAPGGQPIALLHTDRRPGARPVDALDRDALWSFAEGFGRAFRRAVLHEELDAHRVRLRERFAAAEDVMLALAHAEIELVPGEPQGWDGVEVVAEPRRPERTAWELTDREWQVLELLAQGRTNRQVAAALVISESTVKSHVKRVLRKIGAANRTQAISVYLAESRG